MEVLCECVNNTLSLYYASNTLSDSKLVYILMSLSLIFDGVAYFYIKSFSGLQAHPMKIFGWISLSNFCFMWPTLLMTFTCDLKLDVIYQYTSSFGFHTTEDALSKLMTLIPFQITFWYNMVIMLNIMLCLDLILTFRSPFKKPESRYAAYLSISVFVSILPAVVRTLFMTHSEQFLYGWIIVGSFFVYLVVAILSIYYAFKHLSKPGMSSEARGMTTRRHISFILANVLCQMYNVLSKVTTNVNPGKNFNGWVLNILAALYFGQGIWLNLVRLLEPSYLPTFCFYTKNKICTRNARKSAEKAQGKSQNAWMEIDQACKDAAKKPERTVSVIMETEECFEDNSSDEENSALG